MRLAHRRCRAFLPAFAFNNFTTHSVSPPKHLANRQVPLFQSTTLLHVRVRNPCNQSFWTLQWCGSPTQKATLIRWPMNPLSSLRSTPCLVPFVPRSSCPRPHARRRRPPPTSRANSAVSYSSSNLHDHGSWASASAHTTQTAP